MKAFEPHEGDVDLRNSFSEAWYFLLGAGEVELRTDRGADFKANSSITSSGPHKGEKTIRFMKGKQESARSYPCCWGHYYNCYGTRLGMYCKTLDNLITKKQYK